MPKDVMDCDSPNWLRVISALADASHAASSTAVTVTVKADAVAAVSITAQANAILRIKRCAQPEPKPLIVSSSSFDVYQPALLERPRLAAVRHYIPLPQWRQ
jgi:hypothetical protein